MVLLGIMEKAKNTLRSDRGFLTLPLDLPLLVHTVLNTDEITNIIKIYCNDIINKEVQ